MRKLIAPLPPAPVRPQTAREPLLEGVVCWDFDETLGRFYGIAARMNGHPYEGVDGLRHGIRSVLGDLSGKGLRHVLTTAAPKDYVSEALSRAGLAGYFSCVFTEKEILSGGRKDYLVVAEALGIPEGEFWRRSLVVGDIHQIDCPRRGVFLYEPHSPSYSAIIPGQIIALLLHPGGGDVANGFSRLFRQGHPLPADAELPPGASGLRTESFSAALYYEGQTGIIRVGGAAEACKHPLESF